ncbi:Prephenate dehydratase [Psychromonas ingrahamii 37]|uniref:prephenate dehydratase n=1 Tax=Psychromonas ingrahamii (strain DSM 17664 / CCUG 51855 / 37) TaxID=357804 RepID=A1SSL5_PSYIN|nr:prephenate dehydratase domain-containing protein [Psychromonas ingrahamii]ABM02480.1 Prephenate dehydratase [Psychromonas ingrahamii 37]
MPKIATLGPKETFSDLATQQYLQSQNRAYEIKYFNSLPETFAAIGNDCEMGVLPIENLSEGYVQVVLDHLFDTNLVVISEILLPIRFSFVASCANLSELTDLYVQFVAHGQCSEFIDKLGNIKVHNTQSNIESLLLAQKHGDGAGAIIPQHALNMAKNQTLIRGNVTNYKNNQTRFLVLTDKPQPRLAEQQYKTTLVVKNEKDSPGVLGNIVAAFAEQKVNLTSIMSRPTKSEFGKYHFFIDIDGHQEDPDVDRALQQIMRQHPVTILGSYIKASK